MQAIFKILILERIEVIVFFIVQVVLIVHYFIRLIVVSFTLCIVELTLLIFLIVIIRIKRNFYTILTGISAALRTTCSRQLPSRRAITPATATTLASAPTALLASITPPSTTTVKAHLVFIVHLELLLVRDATAIDADESLA